MSQTQTLDEYVEVLGNVAGRFAEKIAESSGMEDGVFEMFIQADHQLHEAKMEKFRQDFARKKYVKGVEATTELTSPPIPSHSHRLRHPDIPYDEGELYLPCPRYGDKTLIVLTMEEAEHLESCLEVFRRISEEGENEPNKRTDTAFTEPAS